MAATRTAVDRNAASFVPIDPSNVLVLGTDGKLWLESGPFGHVPPSRVYVGSGIKAYKPVRTTGDLQVLRTDLTLWLYRNPKPVDVPTCRRAGRRQTPPPIHVDANVADFYSYTGRRSTCSGPTATCGRRARPSGKFRPPASPSTLA